MIKAIKEWFRKRREAQFEAFIKQKEDAAKAEAAKLQEAINLALKQQEDSLKTSEEPWVKLESGELHPEHGIQLKLDWNGAFIDYLKKDCGFTGPDDEAIMQKYIGAVYKEIYESGNNEQLLAMSEKLKE